MISARFEKDEDTKKRLRAIYTPLNVAKKEIWRRWNDENLKKKVADYLGDIPEPFKNGPRAVLSRHVISPNMEFNYFYNLAKEIELEPLGLEGVIDNFCTANPDKSSLGKMPIIKIKKGCEGYAEKRYFRAIDLGKNEGEKICDIKTLWGENFVEFHHRILNSLFPDIEIFDDFIWFKKNNCSISPESYYSRFLSFFLCFGVLFENFYLDRNEIKFTNEVVVPNFLSIEKKFGVKPLIVPLAPLEDETSFYWQCYPDSLNEILNVK